MNHIAFFSALSFLVLFLWGCGTSSSSDSSTNSPAEGEVEYNMIEISETLNDCPVQKEGCTFYSVEYPHFSGRYKLFNSFVRDSILESSDSADLRRSGKRFIEEHRETYRDYPEEAVPWRYLKQVDFEVLGDTLIHFTVLLDEYTGGNNPGGKEEHRSLKMNVEPATYKDFFGDVSREEMSQRITKEYLSDPEAQENVLFEDRIPVTRNFIPSEENVIFVYNTYDIAPYSAGIIRVSVPR